MTPRLKSLELHGYKTFASRTQFEFPGDLTAIVGPNGSGKSNIADALRWVLGEQAFSLLRGRKTEDMIFSGSEQRSRAGMASATITFSNEDGWLPIDFSEVAITRRAYRDGQNEYLLNGQKVRLKEISELLAQSGLAERTYTIIGQGLVDAALSLKPEERRRFFEEAAGIGLYRSRREESLNRLEATRRNLVRISDILSELEPRLHSLERQAKRAEDYERLKADLRKLMREWYGYQWHQSQKNLSQQRELLKNHEGILEQARQKKGTVDQELNDFRIQIQALRKELSAWHSSQSSYHQERESVLRNLAVMEERVRSLEAQLKRQDEDYDALTAERQTQQARLQAAGEEEARQKNSLEEARQQAQLAVETLKSRQADRQKVELEIRDLRNRRIARETALIQKRAHLQELENRRENLEISVQRAEGLLAETNAGFSAIQKKTEVSKSNLQGCEAEVKDLEKELERTRQEIDRLEESRKSIQSSTASLEAENAKIAAHIEVIEQAEKNLSGFSDGAKVVLDAARSGRLGGRFQPISRLIEVSEEYEAAVAAALGEFLDGILFDQSSDPDNAMDLLAEGEKGRAALLPMISPINLAKKDRFSKGEGVIGFASDLVRTANEFEPALLSLLARTVVVKDRKAAREYLKSNKEINKVVTLNGEVFYHNGAVLAGRETRGGLIGSNRVKRELKARLEKNNKALVEISQQEAGVNEKIDLQIVKQKNLAADLETGMEVAARAQREFQQSILEVEQAIQKRSWQDQQIQSFHTQANQCRSEIEEDKKQILNLENQITDLNINIKDLNKKVLDNLLEEYQQQVYHWNTRMAVVEQALTGAARRRGELQSDIERNVQQHEANQKRKRDIALQLDQLREEIVIRLDEESRLNKKIVELQEKIQPGEAELERKEKAAAEIEEKQTGSQQTLSFAEKHYSQIKLEFTRTKDTIETLRQRIEEDFGLVAFEFTNDMTGQTPLPLEGLVEQLPTIKEIPPDLEDNINRQRAQLRRMGSINPDAQNEYHSVKERFDFLTGQVGDLKKADSDLCEVIAELDDLMQAEFQKTFTRVSAEFRLMFNRLFGGGNAHLMLTDEDHFNDTGIDIEARLPGRREQGLSLLSGGERSLTAVALIFALLKVSPTPFCVLDEVDAMLDEANVGRFRDLLEELSDNTQFIVITHNRNTVQAADVIYGITMGRDSASQVISLKLDEVSDDLVK